MPRPLFVPTSSLARGSLLASETQQPSRASSPPRSRSVAEAAVLTAFALLAGFAAGFFGFRKHPDTLQMLATSGTPPQSAPLPPSLLFERLCAASGASTGLTLSSIPGPSRRGLVTPVAVKEGAVLLEVPLSTCIVEPNALPAELEDQGLPESFTWDVRLAVKLLEAVEGRGDLFWEGYANLFPPPHDLALPFLLPPSLLPDMQHPEAMAAALAQQERLRDLFPDMVPSPDAPEAEYPTPLMWAWALVRSRAFSCGPNHFAFVPFLDMANHAGHPNADFECAVRAGGSYTLRAACPLPAGAEVTISYAPRMDNQRQFAQYGFVAPGGNPHDTVAALADPTRPLCRSRLHTTLRSRGMDPDDWSTLAAPVAATLRCLPFASGAPLSVELEIENVMAHLKALEVVAASDFPTTLEADMSATRELLKGPEVPDQRRLALLMYRVERKLLSASARAILQDHLQALQSDPLRT